MDNLILKFLEVKDIKGKSLMNNSAESELNNSLGFNFPNHTRSNTTISEEFYRIIHEHVHNNIRNLPITVEIILIIIYSFLIFAGLVTNILVCFVVARRKQMHTARNLYIVNLTISDISLCLICMPFTLIKILERRWTLGAGLCKLISVLEGTNIMVSVGTITVIALDRYFTICKKTTQNVASTRRRVIIFIFLIWLSSLLTTLPLMFYQVTEPVKLAEFEYFLYEVCIEQWPSSMIRIIYAVAILLIMAVIPPLVIGVVHARIAKYLNEHARTQKDSRRAQKELERNKKTTLLLSGIVIICTISWLPLGAFSLMLDLYDQIPPENLYTGLAVTHIIAMTSAVSNPVFYGWLNSNMRQEFLQLLPKSCSARRSKPPQSEVVVGATTVETDARTHIHYHSGENEVNDRKESIALLVSLNNKNLNNNPNPQNFAHL